MDAEQTKLVNQMNRELGEINAKMEENHQVHVDNRNDIKEIKVSVESLNDKVGFQNGRVTSLEKTVEKLAIVESQNSGLIRACQETQKETNHVVNELKHINDKESEAIERNKQAFMGIKYHILEKIIWAIIIVIAANFNHIVGGLYKIFTGHILIIK